MNDVNYVIIGNSAAAVGAVEGIRSTDKLSKITIISKEQYHTYSRPLISYLVREKTTLEKMKYRPNTFYEDNNCTVLLSKTVVAVHPENKNIILDDETRINYDKLLFATGSSPFTIPIKGLDSVESQHYFYSLDDAKGLMQKINSESKVLILGAGLIGLKCAEGLSGKVKSINVIDIAPRILSSILDDFGAGIIQRHLQEHLININLSDKVEFFDENLATLESGEEIVFDELVLAIGVRPNNHLAIECGCKANNGIVINDYMQTTMSDIYAAGDCAEVYDITVQKKRVLPLLPIAYMQGECAGLNMAGKQNVFSQGIPMNAIGFFGKHVITAGVYEGESYVCEESGYKKLFFKDDILKGYILIDDIEKAGIYTALIRDKTPLSSIDFDLICKKPSLIAFSREYRNDVLGGNKK